MLTIVGWLWKDRECRTRYSPTHANAWAKMLHRNITIPHRFVLLTDDTRRKYSSLIEPVKLWKDWRNVECPEWRREFPQCWVRLKAFSRGMRKVLGDRFVSIDLDCVVLGNLDTILCRTEDFLICRRAPVRATDMDNVYQASMWMMNAGAREQVWKDFKGEETFEELREHPQAKHYLATDQGWMLYKLGPNEATWGMRDGVYFWPWIRANGGIPPEDARIVFFQGQEKPWDLELEWVKQHYR